MAKALKYQRFSISKHSVKPNLKTTRYNSFPDGNSALMLICARIRYVTANEWSTRRYLDMSRLDDNLQEAN